MKPMNLKLLRPITNDAEHSRALQRFTELFEPRPESEEYNEFYLLGLLIHDYESKQHPIDPPPPNEVVKFRLEQMGLKPKDLVGVIGSSGRVSEVLSGKRPLTLDMIRRLKVHLGISPDLLLGETDALRPKTRRSQATRPRNMVAETRRKLRS